MQKKALTASGTEEDATNSEYVFCQLCQKDLSHMNSHRRTLHINRCMDEVSGFCRLSDWKPGLRDTESVISCIIYRRVESLPGCFVWLKLVIGELYSGRESI